MVLRRFWRPCDTFVSLLERAFDRFANNRAHGRRAGLASGHAIRAEEMDMARGLRWLAVAVVFVSIGGSAAAQTPAPATSTAGNGLAIDPALRDDIVRLMDMTGVSARATQMAGLASDAVLSGMRQTQPSIPPRAIEVVKEVLKSE